MGFIASDKVEDDIKSNLVGFMSSIKKKKGMVTISDFDKLSAKDKKSAYLSPEWDDFVMGQFVDSELADGHPRANGLRRVAELLLGDIIESIPIDIHPVAIRDETQRSTVGYSIKFLWFDGSERTYADVADVFSGNQDPDFLIYSVATAATRAEVRALRKALKLKKCAAEEIGPKNDRTESRTKATVQDNMEESISTQQIKFINKRCSDLDINVLKLLNKGQEQYDVIEEMTKSEAKLLIDFLSEVAKEAVVLDDSLKGYDSSWRD